MNIGILSRNRNLYSTRRLVEEGKKLGHTVQVLNPLLCKLLVAQKSITMFYGERQIPHFDVIIPRIGTSITDYGIAVINHFELMGVPVLNGAFGISRSRDKLRSLQLLAERGINIPKTFMARKIDNLQKTLNMVGGVPVILKLLQGSQGVGVMIAESLDSAESVLDTFWNLEQNILIQEYVRESRGRDVRALVMGDRIVAAMRRFAKPGRFRSNIHRGGYGEIVDLDPVFRKTALDAARVMKLQVAGVDLLESESGPKVMEVNSSPGFEGLEEATKQNIAGKIIEHACEYAKSFRPKKPRKKRP
ncbi:MAG: RimK family alpha-L-glutamate ligase [Deltaproteobacteria bacterium]|nr:RimK family alpha-L-glutamate ligase [Deltaproteobacteria bacterium]